MEYKVFEKSDIEMVSAMYAEAFNNEPWCEKWTGKIASKRLLDSLENKNSFGLLAVAGGEIVGMVLGEEKQCFDGKAFSVEELCVKYSERRKGIGTALLKELENELKNRGIRAIELTTAPEIDEFYRKIGYQRSEMVIMGKEL